VSAVISEEKNELLPLLKSQGIFLNKKDYQLDIRSLIKLVMSKVFGDPTCIVDSLVQHIPSTLQATAQKVQNTYTSNLSDIPQTCSQQSAFCCHISKLYHDEELKGFYALGRIYSGSVKPGDKVKVLGENYT
jgi:U5 small nuclear ribonucleoprotein component